MGRRRSSARRRGAEVTRPHATRPRGANGDRRGLVGAPSMTSSSRALRFPTPRTATTPLRGGTFLPKQSSKEIGYAEGARLEQRHRAGAQRLASCCRLKGRAQREMAGAEDVRLLGFWSSSFVTRAQIALKLKEVEYEFVEETTNPTKSELLLKSNPVYKKIPVLIHNGNPVCESLIIVQYVDEAWSSGHQILPADPYDRALARFWATYVDDKWFPSLLGVVKAQTDEERASFLEQMLTGLPPLEEAFAACSKGKPFFGGDSVGYLDIALGCYLGWARAIEQMYGVQILDEAKTPQLAAWAERFSAHEAVEEVMPETEKLVEYAKVVQARWKAAPAPAN